MLGVASLCVAASGCWGSHHCVLKVGWLVGAGGRITVC